MYANARTYQLGLMRWFFCETHHTCKFWSSSSQGAALPAEYPRSSTAIVTKAALITNSRTQGWVVHLWRIVMKHHLNGHVREAIQVANESSISLRTSSSVRPLRTGT
jgi:hypothetical protein